MKRDLKILFIYRGYGEHLSNSVIDFQLNSLKKAGIEIETFTITRGSLTGYYESVRQLRRYLQRNSFSAIHAHYSFSGFCAKLATSKPVICSLMGSDVFQQNRVTRFITWFFYTFFWSCTIVKSQEMKKYFPHAFLIPNGVDFSNFKEIDKDTALRRTGFLKSRKNIIFVAQDANMRVKNLALAKRSIQLLDDPTIELHIISDKPVSELPFYYNAADLLLLTSLSEGSPNVIKEAMACNCPIVAVNVGDIKEIIKDTEGTFLCSHDEKEIAFNIKRALEFGKRTNGRSKIEHLDDQVIARMINDIYQKVAGER
jgi:glycosyltransferase involved in cell wall biosynthesis